MEEIVRILFLFNIALIIGILHAKFLIYISDVIVFTFNHYGGTKEEFDKWREEIHRWEVKKK